MFKNEIGDINRVKCIVCLDVKGKDVILGPKFDMLEKHVGKTNNSKYATFGKEGKEVLCEQ
jgi:hypothetical protein